MMKRAELSFFLLLIFLLHASCFSRFPQRKGATNTQNKDAPQKDKTIGLKNGKCYYNGLSYNYGEKIPTEDNCLTCICNDEFNQRDISACVRMECPHDHFKHLYSSCVPLYDKDQCCPVRWDCGKGLAKLDSQCKCNLKYLRHYEAKNCTPVYEIEGCACPTRFICPPEKELDPTVCRYEGKIYQIGTEIETGAPCERCRCHRHTGQERASFDCLNIECPASLTSPLEEGCYRSHNLSYCCSVDTICPAKNEKVGQCEYNGQLYNLGQKIYPKEEPCITCLCTKDWTGIYSNNCIRNKCFMGQYGNLERGCIPIYHEETCCHVEFHCPEQRDQEKAIQRATLDKGIPERCVLPAEKGPCYANFEHYYFNILKRKCEPFRYGGCLGNQNNFLTLQECQSTCETKLRTTNTNLDHMCYFDGHYYNIGEEYAINHPTGCVTCTCNVPPDLTCVYRACPSPPHDYGTCKGVYTPGVCCPQYNCTKADGEIVIWSSSIKTETCGTPICPPGCEILEDSTPGICSGCQCQFITASSSVVENCPEVTCPSPFCVKYRSTNGCPQCICELRGSQAISSSSWNRTGEQSSYQAGYSSKQFGFQAGASSEQSGFKMGSSSIESGFQQQLSKQSGFQMESSSKQSDFQSTSLSKKSGFEVGTLTKQSGFQSGSSSEQDSFQLASSSKQSGYQIGSSSEQSGFQAGLSEQTGFQVGSSSKQSGLQMGSSTKELGIQKIPSTKGPSVQEGTLSVKPGMKKKLPSPTASRPAKTPSEKPGMQRESPGMPGKQRGPAKQTQLNAGLSSRPYGLQMEYSSEKSDSQRKISSVTDRSKEKSAAGAGKKCIPIKCEYSCS